MSGQQDVRRLIVKGRGNVSEAERCGRADLRIELEGGAGSRRDE